MSLVRLNHKLLSGCKTLTLETDNAHHKSGNKRLVRLNHKLLSGCKTLTLETDKAHHKSGCKTLTNETGRPTLSLFIRC